MGEVAEGGFGGLGVTDPDPVAVDGAEGAGGRQPAEKLVYFLRELVGRCVAFVRVVRFPRRNSRHGDVFQRKGVGVREGGCECSGGIVFWRRFESKGGAVEVPAERGVACSVEFSCECFLCVSGGEWS